MKTILIRVLSFCFLLFSVLSSSNIYALEEMESHPSPVYPRPKLVTLFEANGTFVPDGALLSVTEQNIDGITKYIPTMVSIDGNLVSSSYLLDMLTASDGSTQVLDVSQSLNTNINQIAASSGFSRSGVTATAYYYQTSSIYTYYRPYSASFISTSAKNVYVKYIIHGDPYNVSTLTYVSNANEDFIISISKYPASANQFYQTNYTAPYYYRPVAYLNGLHNLYLTVNGTSYTLVVSTPQS